MSDLGASSTVLARPTIFGQFHNGRSPTVAPGRPRKSSASETVLVSSAAKRSSKLLLIMGKPQW
ncbi:hypothetical protein D3C75_1329910 [compost metagenome]